LRVLIVDDEMAIRQTLRMFIEDEGYQVLEAGDGEAAVAAARASTEALVVLLDYMMPRLDGPGVLRLAEGDLALARHGYILLSARTRAHALTMLAAHPTLRVTSLMKPFDLNELAATVAMMAAAISPALAPPASDAPDTPPPGGN
jgi:two-component system alkaline phosphatase synthesis response regulator PhoP